MQNRAFCCPDVVNLLGKLLVVDPDSVLVKHLSGSIVEVRQEIVSEATKPPVESEI